VVGEREVVVDDGVIPNVVVGVPTWLNFGALAL